jgi:hypothetical protein
VKCPWSKLLILYKLSTYGLCNFFRGQEAFPKTEVLGKLLMDYDIISVINRQSAGIRGKGFYPADFPGYRAHFKILAPPDRRILKHAIDYFFFFY